MIRLVNYKQFMSINESLSNDLPSYADCIKLCEDSDSAFYETVHYVDGFKISMFNYRLATWKDFRLPGAKEMRGITFVFNSDGTLFKRYILLEKFFNLNQVPDTMYSIVKGYKIKFVNNKEDGSIASFIKLPNGRVIGKSKMSVTSSQALSITKLYQERQDIREFVNWTLEQDIVAIFEYVAPTNRIVLKYADEDLILLRLRDNKTGKHIDLLKHKSKLGRIKIAPFYDDFKDLDSLIELTANQVGSEGWVVQAVDDSGKDFFFKLKSPWYVNRHALMTEVIFRENDIITMILDNEVDDLLGQIPEEEAEARQRIERINQIVISEFTKRRKDLESEYSKFVSAGSDRKAYALANRDNKHFSDVMAMSKGVEADYLVIRHLKDETSRLMSARNWLRNLDRDFEFVDSDQPTSE